MKKFLVVLLSMITSIMIMGNIMDYIPKDYVSITVYKNVANIYNNLKSTTTFSFFLDTMGFESLIKNMLQAQLLSHGLELDDFLSVFSNEIMVVTFDNKDMCVIAGSSENIDKIVSVLKGIIPQMLGEWISVEAYEKYVFIAGKKESIEKCKEGGGTIPEIFPENACAISYSPSLELEDMLFSTKAYSLFENGKVVSEGTIIPLNQSAKDFLSNLEAVEEGFENMLAGEFTLYFNMKDPVRFLEILTKGLKEIKQSEISFEVKPLDEEEKEILENLKEKVHGLGYVALDFHEPLVELMMGATEVTTQPKLKISFKADLTSQDLEEFFKSGEISYEKKGNYYIAEEFYVEIKNGYVNVYYPDSNVSFNPEALDKVKKHMEGNESLLLYVDFSKFIENLSGMQEEAYILLKLKVINGRIHTSFILK